jgi:hypothetical protein
MNHPLLSAAVLGCVLSGFAFAGSVNAAGSARSPRGELVRQIVLKWGVHVQGVYGADVREWAMDMAPVFAKAPLPMLRRAATAPTFEQMNDAFLVDDRGQNAHTRLADAIHTGQANASGKALGDAANDLVFVPITPCRIVDTRLALGPITANNVRSFEVVGAPSYALQGGQNDDCGLGTAASTAAAAAINFTVVAPTAAGFITAFPFNTTQPLAATVNYTAGDIRGNFAIVKLDQTAAANEMTVYTFAQTHLVADLVGYYVEPEATALDCLEVTSSTATIAAGDFSTRTTAACLSGYTFVGGGCTMSDFDGRMVSSRPQVVNHFCAWRNEGADSVQGIAYGRCCRTPGR